jgi:hypothetical protein
LNPDLPVSDRIVAGVAFLLGNNPKRAVAELERARAEAPNVEEGHAMLAAAYVLSGQVEDARAAAEEAVKLAPNLSVEMYRALLSHFRNEGHVDTILAALEAAGVPRWPYGFAADPSSRLSTGELRGLALGRTWQGRIQNGDPALTQIQANGKFAFRTTSHIATGRAFVSDDMLCEEVAAVSLGRPLCGWIFRNDDATTENDFEYTYVNPVKVFRFSPVQ